MSFMHVAINKKAKALSRNLSTNILIDTRTLAKNACWDEPRTLWQSFLYKFKNKKWARRMLGGAWIAYLTQTGRKFTGEQWHKLKPSATTYVKPSYKKELYQ